MKVKNVSNVILFPFFPFSKLTDIIDEENLIENSVTDL